MSDETNAANAAPATRTGYAELGGNVVLTMTLQDYERLLQAMGFYMGGLIKTFPEKLNDLAAWANRVNDGNPHFTPYEVLPESDRQAILLAIARLSVERPGWLSYLEGIAEKLHGREMFNVFRKYKLEEGPR